jgi:hypothetical protein
MPSNIEPYGKTYEELLDYATDEFRNFLHERGLIYDQEITGKLLEELELDDYALWWSFFE